MWPSCVRSLAPRMNSYEWLALPFSEGGVLQGREMFYIRFKFCNPTGPTLGDKVQAPLAVGFSPNSLTQRQRYLVCNKTKKIGLSGLWGFGGVLRDPSVDHIGTQ